MNLVGSATNGIFQYYGTNNCGVRASFFFFNFICVLQVTMLLCMLVSWSCNMFSMLVCYVSIEVVGS